MSTLKEVIKEAGRYDKIIELINDILISANSSIPVKAQQNYNNEFVTRVEPSELREGVKIWNRLINIEQSELSNVEEDFKIKLEPFEMVVHSDLEIRMHNYVVDLSHRKSPSDKELEDIRALEILESSIYAINCGCLTDENDNFYPWDIPDGWKVQ